MDNAAVQEAFKRIDAMAEKMGTTAQYMWPKLVAYTQGIAITQAVMGVIVFAILSALFAWSVKKGIKDDWEDMFNFIVAIASGMFLFTLLGLSISEGPEVLASIISPEAAAFYKLVGR